MKGPKSSLPKKTGAYIAPKPPSVRPPTCMAPDERKLCSQKALLHIFTYNTILFVNSI